jgi:hypothetical protein
MSGASVVMPGDFTLNLPFGRSTLSEDPNDIQLDSDHTGQGGVRSVWTVPQSVVRADVVHGLAPQHRKIRIVCWICVTVRGKRANAAPGHAERAAGHEHVEPYRVRGAKTGELGDGAAPCSPSPSVILLLMLSWDVRHSWALLTPSFYYQLSAPGLAAGPRVQVIKTGKGDIELEWALHVLHGLF